MLPGEVIYRVTAVACADASETVAVYPRFPGHVVDGAEVIADVLAAVITRNLVEPLLSERRYAAAVRGYDHISLGGHELEVPAVAPELAHHVLRAALAIEQGGVLLVRVEVGGKYHPCQHLLAVGGRYPAFLYFAHLHVVVDVLVHEGQLVEGAVVHAVELRSLRDAHLFRDAYAVGIGEGGDVVVAARDDLYGRYALDIHRAELAGGFDGRKEEDGAVIFPYEIVGVVIEGFGQVAERTVRAVPYEETVLVRFVARTAHALEGDVTVVGREYGVFVVAGESRGDFQARVVGGSCLVDVGDGTFRHVVDEDVRIGGLCVFRTGHLLAGVGELRAGVVPRDFLHVEVGGQRCVPCFAGHDVLAGMGLLAVEFADEYVFVVTPVPIVPVARHEVVVDEAFRFVEVGIDVLRFDVGYVYVLYVIKMVAFRGDAESFDAAFYIGYLMYPLAVGTDGPYLTFAGTVAEEVDGLAVGTPLGRVVIDRIDGELLGLAALRGHEIEVRQAAVLLHVIPCHAVNHALAVGRQYALAHASHFPHDLRGEYSRPDFGFGHVAVDVERYDLVLAGTVARAGYCYRCCHK